MFKFVYVIFINLWRYFFVVPYMKMCAVNEKRTTLQNYRLVQWVCNKVRKGIHVVTKAYGTENLPKEGGYVMYPNHQGKYDALGILLTHDQPCSFVIEEKASKQTILTEVVDLVNGKRLDNSNPRKAIRVISEVSKEVKSGIRYILFPEGYWDKSGNEMHEFRAGAFKCAVRAKAPIVPVALVDSYKAFMGYDLIHPTYTYVYYLKPIYYDEYCEMNTQQIRTVRYRS